MGFRSVLLQLCRQQKWTAWKSCQVQAYSRGIDYVSDMIVNCEIRRGGHGLLINIRMSLSNVLRTILFSSQVLQFHLHCQHTFLGANVWWAENIKQKDAKFFERIAVQQGANSHVPWCRAHRRDGKTSEACKRTPWKLFWYLVRRLNVKHKFGNSLRQTVITVTGHVKFCIVWVINMAINAVTKHFCVEKYQHGGYVSLLMIICLWYIDYSLTMLSVLGLHSGEWQDMRIIKRIWYRRKRSWRIIRETSTAAWKTWRKPRKKSTHDSWCPAWYSKWALLEHKSETLPLEPSCFVLVGLVPPMCLHIMNDSLDLLTITQFPAP